MLGGSLQQAVPSSSCPSLAWRSALAAALGFHSSLSCDDRFAAQLAHEGKRLLLLVPDCKHSPFLKRQ